MDFGLGDIANGIRIALAIYEYGFVEENTAHYRYREFLNDVLNFRRLLQLLERALEDAHTRFLEGGYLANSVGACDPLTSPFEAEREAIVGNFEKTLRDCEDLLQQDKKFRTRYATVLENIEWNFFRQQKLRMEDLRRRLHFHSLKIRLVIDRLSITLLTDADSKLDAILATTTENLQVSRDILDEVTSIRHRLFGNSTDRESPMTQRLLDVPPQVSLRFEKALEFNGPSTYRTHLPLPEAFDALWFRFGESVQGTGSTAEKRVQLLKCCWLLKQIKQSPAFQEAAPAFYYRRAVTQVDVALRPLLLRATTAEAPDVTAIMALSEDCFQIWLPPPVPPPATVLVQQPNPVVTQGGERQIASIKLAADGRGVPDVVHIFQSGYENYRIALETRTQDGEPYIRERELYTREHRLIPRYALPTMPDTIPEVAIFSHGRCHFYHFQQYEDLWKFQAAITGHEVSHDQSAVTFQFGPKLDSFVCKGHVQLWQEPIEFTSSTSTATVTAAGRAGSSRRPSSVKSQPSFAPSLGQTTNFIVTEDAYIAQNVKSSALVIYTQLTHLKGGQPFAIIHLELHRDVFIDPSQCSCSHSYDKCSNLVIAARPNARLGLRMLHSTQVEGQQDPNTFDILPLRLPRRPEYRSMKVHETEHIILKFETLKAKKTFHKELETRFRIHDIQVNNMADVKSQYRHQANRPVPTKRRDAHVAPHSPSTRLSRSTSSKPEPAPQLGQPEPGPPFAVDISRVAIPGRRRDLDVTTESASYSTSPRSNNSGLTSLSAGSRSNDSPRDEHDHHLSGNASPSDLPSRMQALLGGYGMDTSSGPVSASQPSSTRPTDSWPTSPVSGQGLLSPRTTLSFDHNQETTHTMPDSPGTRSPARRGTGSTYQTARTASSGNTAQFFQSQELKQIRSSQSSGGKSARGFISHVFGKGQKASK